MNIKKLIAIMLTAAFVLALASCSNDNDSFDDENNNGNNNGGENVYTDSENTAYEFTYDVNLDGTYELTSFKYTGIDKIEVKIPAKIGDRKVTGLGNDLFKAVKTVEKVTFEEGSELDYIGEFTFYDCDSITGIVLPDTVTSIGMGAFWGCDNLKSVNFPAGITEICDFAFKDCKALEDAVLPEALLTIGAASFWGCTSITKVELPKNLTDIGDAAFYGCEKLQFVEFLGTAVGETVVNEDKTETKHFIGDIVFNSCHPELMITVSDQSTEVVKYANDNNYNLNLVTG